MKGIVPKTPDLREDSEDYMVYAFATPRTAFPKELLPLLDKSNFFTEQKVTIWFLMY